VIALCPLKGEDLLEDEVLAAQCWEDLPEDEVLAAQSWEDLLEGEEKEEKEGREGKGKEKEKEKESGPGDASLIFEAHLADSSNSLVVIGCKQDGLLVGGKPWSNEQLLNALIGSGRKLKKKKREKLAKDNSGVHDAIKPFFEEICSFLSENHYALFKFENEIQLKQDLRDNYLDEHLEDCNQFQRLTHDVRGAEFMRENFPHFNLGPVKKGVCEVKPRDLRADWRPIFQMITAFLETGPSKEVYNRPTGNLWVFRTMYLSAAQYLARNFVQLKKAADEAVRMILNNETEKLERFLHNTFDTQENRLMLWNALAGHYGDLIQALTYSRETDESKPKILVGFEIKENAELLLFHPYLVCIAGQHVDMANTSVGKNYEIIKVMMDKFGCVNTATGSDGILAGWLSLKHELKGDFSFGLASTAMSYVLFLLLVSRMKLFGSLEDRPGRTKTPR
jgi:hypothetical protein